jgi:hypothetical protein
LAHYQDVLRTFLGLAVFAAPSPALAAVRNVDCTKGETITTALMNAVPGDTIRITGTCRERITITTDQLTLVGARFFVSPYRRDAPFRVRAP